MVPSSHTCGFFPRTADAVVGSVPRQSLTNFNNVDNSFSLLDSEKLVSEKLIIITN